MLGDILKIERKMTLEEALNLVKCYFKKEPEKYNLWLTTKNPFLGGVSPVWMIAVGRQDKLINFIEERLVKNIWV